jgi:hypothetical protein
VQLRLVRILYSNVGNENLIVMSPTARTIRIYSLYLFLMGGALVLVPNVMLSVLGFPTTQEVWIRMLGLFTLTVGIYYWQCARQEQRAFYRATVLGRLFFFSATAALTAVCHQPFMLAAIGCVDLLGALWTYSTLRNA